MNRVRYLFGYASLQVIAGLLCLQPDADAATPVSTQNTPTSYQAIDQGSVAQRAPFAGDIKVFPGILCRPLLAQTADFIIEPAAMKNVGAATMGVACPLVRDNALNADGIPSVEINIWNATSGVDFHCVIYNYDKFGMIFSFRSDSTASVGQKTFTLYLPNSTPSGYYSIFCNVPPNSRIYSYRLIERPETNTEPY